MRNNTTLKEYGRGVVGGLIFSLPLIYTMEVWYTGFSASPGYLISCIVGTFLLLLGYNRYAGMRKDTCFSDLCWDSMEEIGLAFIVSFVFLLLISQITFAMSIQEIVGKVVVESMIVAIGISVGTAQLGQNGDDDTGMDESRDETPTNRLFKLIILSICGATLFASAVAPTDEIVMIAVESELLHLVAIVIVSLLLCTMTLFFSQFTGGKSPQSHYADIAFNVVISYVSALLVSFMLLLFFGRVTDTGLEVVVAEIIVLGIPAAIGASAGRLLIDKSSDEKEKS